MARYQFHERDQSPERAEELLEQANAGRPLSFEDLADLVNLAGVPISRARIWQLEQSAMRKLRRNAERFSLEQY